MQTVILTIYFILIICLAFYSTHAYLMLYYYFKGRKDNNRRRKFKYKNRDLPYVTIQLPMYNEKYVAERLINSACAVDYPKERLEIQILDDSTDETTFIVKRLVEKYQNLGFNIVLLHRNIRKGYKAGALDDGLKKAKGEFIAIFDADFIIPRNFLKKTLPYFSNEKICAVQTRWGHINKNYSVLTLGQAIALDGHFYIEQNIRSQKNFFLNFNGTCGIWRKSAIIDAGGWQDDTLTEDLDLSYRAQLKGWKIEFLLDVVCPGEVPVDFNGFRKQQFRWTKGAFETARKLLPTVIKSKFAPLKKLEAFIHLTNNMVFPILLALTLLSLPVLIIKVESGHSLSWYFRILSIFTIAVFPYPLIYGISQRNLNHRRTRKKRFRWQKIFEKFVPIFLIGGFVSLSLSNTWAIIKALRRKPTEFSRTPKFRITSKKDTFSGKKYQEKISPIVFLELIITLYLLVTTTYAFIEGQFTLAPFLLLYTLGFGYLSVASIYQSASNYFTFVYQTEKALIDS
ncbi:MAG: glycosyltransferase family 2 protein [candidate division WOR-3 bacterium]|nr:glycosyltransferase family 2 protein [candidate division WOR-3 bacterium]